MAQPSNKTHQQMSAKGTQILCVQLIVIDQKGLKDLCGNAFDTITRRMEEIICIIQFQLQHMPAKRMHWNMNFNLNYNLSKDGCWTNFFDSFRMHFQTFPNKARRL